MWLTNIIDFDLYNDLNRYFTNSKCCMVGVVPVAVSGLFLAHIVVLCQGISWCFFLSRQTRCVECVSNELVLKSQRTTGNCKSHCSLNWNLFFMNCIHDVEFLLLEFTLWRFLFIQNVFTIVRNWTTKPFSCAFLFTVCILPHAAGSAG